MNTLKSTLIAISTFALIACGGSDSSNSSTGLSLTDVSGVWEYNRDGDSYTVFDSTGFKNISKRVPVPGISSTFTNTDCYDIKPKVTLTQVAEGKFNATGNTRLGNDRTLKSISLVRNAEALTITFNVQQLSLDKDITTVQSITTVYPTNLKVTDIKPICDS